jgi:hypothetical protein
MSSFFEHPNKKAKRYEIDLAIETKITNDGIAEIGLGSKYRKGIIFGLIILMLCQVFISLIAGQMKESYHLDELYTFGLSNSLYKPFVNPETDINIWHSQDFYINYLTVQSSEKYSYDSVNYNQANDVHPPLYYYFMHTISSIYPNIYSKWFGIAFNIPFLIGSTLLLYLLSMKILNDRRLSFIISIMYGLCAGAISNVIFIRMYEMLTFFTVLITYLHVRLIFEEGKFVNNAILLCITNIFGFMTQYLFIVYAFYLAMFYSVYLMKQKNWKRLIWYTLLMSGSLLVCVLFFPQLVDVIFHGEMGSTVIGSLFNILKFILTLGITLLSLGYAFFGGLYLTVIILISVIVFVFYSKISIGFLHENYISRFEPKKKVIYLMLMRASLLTFLTNMAISPYTDAYRYITYLYPNLAILIVLVSYLLINTIILDRKRTLRILVGLVISITLISYINGSIDYSYRYREAQLDERMKAYSTYDAYCITNNQHNMTIAIPLIINHENSCYISSTDTISGFLQLRDVRKDKNQSIVLYFPRWVEEGDSEESTVQEIMEAGRYNSSVQLVTSKSSGLSTSAYLLEK